MPTWKPLPNICDGGIGQFSDLPKNSSEIELLACSTGRYHHVVSLPDAREQEIRRALEHARAGDLGALWDATDAIRPYLRAVAARVLRGRLDAKIDTSDVVQQSLLASIERFAQFRGDSAAEWQQWLVSIVRNEARNLLRFWHQDRRNLAREKAVAGSVVETAKPTEGEKPRLPATQATPSRQVAMRQDATRMIEVLERLPATHREVLRLRHFEGLSHAEIAERLGKSEAAVRQQWVRALAQLRRALAA